MNEFPFSSNPPKPTNSQEEELTRTLGMCRLMFSEILLHEDFMTIGFEERFVDTITQVLISGNDPVTILEDVATSYKEKADPLTNETPLVYFADRIPLLRTKIQNTIALIQPSLQATRDALPPKL